MDIAELRQSIDSVDEQILRLLNERYGYVEEVGKWKRQRAAAIYVPEREKTLLNRLEKLNPGPLSTKALRAIFREIMSGAIALERELIIECPGGEDSPAMRAALGKFGQNIERRSAATVAEVFQDVSAERVDYGVVPIEHSLDGASMETLDQVIACPRVRVCAEIKRRSDIDTEVSTRFLVIGKQEPKPTGDDKTTILFTARNRVGALADMFLPFKKHGISIVMWAARPSKVKNWEYSFFLDFTGHREDAGVSAALAELEPACVDLRVVGSYPSSNDIL